MSKPASAGTVLAAPLGDQTHESRRPTVIRSFIVGAIVGGAAVWYFGPQMREYVDQTTHGVRARAADAMQSAAETLQSAKQTVEPGATGGMPGGGIAGGPERRVV
jgi:hypothetical protein